MVLKKYLFILFFISIHPFLSAQNLVSGIITDENKMPIPAVQIFSKNNPELRTVADEKGYYEMRLFVGEYFLVFRSIGYEDREAYISISDKDIQKNIQLFPSKLNSLEDVEITTKKTNPGREIMLKVVEKKDQMSPWNQAHSCEVYIKASEKIETFEKERKKNENLEETKTFDPFEEKKKADELLLANMNILEVQLTRHFSPPHQIKEIRNAFEERGNTQDLYYKTTVKSDFNFFSNLLHLNDLHQSPVASPISVPGILSYKYRLVEQYKENGKTIHKIKIIPRNTATSTLEGFVWVIDSVWLIQKLDLTLSKGNLLIYDYFKIQQEFENSGDTLSVLTQQILSYGIKNKSKTSTASTIARFSNYNFNPHFSTKFFNNELSVTESEAYEKDSSYWNRTRNIELTIDEKKYIIAKDSITDLQNRKEYLDSVDLAFNKITALKILWFGIDHRNREKKSQWTINALVNTIRPVYIAGPRVALGGFYFKKWKDQRNLDMYSEITYGLLNQDVKGRTHWNYLYDPFHFGHIGVNFVHDFDVIRSYDAITQVYKRNNFIQKTELSFDYTREFFNGFYIYPEIDFAERSNVNNYKFVTTLDKYIPNAEPTEFKTYQALLGKITFTYTPAQKYMKEINRKVLLGSKWPSFYFYYEKGIPRIFGSDVNHEYAIIGMNQTFKLSTLGTTSYHIKTGQFLSSKALYDADYKYNRRSDPIWFSNPLYSFQGLTQSLPSKQIFYEAHFIHHDNGAIINKIPFMKKTRIGLVVGCGALYVKEFDWQHYEFYSGLERNIRINRQILRIGIYGVISDGNHINPTSTWKVSFAMINTRTMKWNF